MSRNVLKGYRFFIRDMHSRNSYSVALVVWGCDTCIIGNAQRWILIGCATSDLSQRRPIKRSLRSCLTLSRNSK